MKGVEIIKFRKIPLTVYFEYDKYYPATLETPEEGGDVNIYSVEVEGVNIIELLTDEVLEEIIEEMSYEEYNDKSY